MSYPTFNPESTTSVTILPVTSSMTEVLAFKSSGSFPQSYYSEDQYFLSGCVEQVSYTYKMLGGDVLDIELTPGNIFSAYQDACYEYSYIINLHQAKSSLHSYLGAPTSSFTHEGQMVSGSSLSGSNIQLSFPKFILAYPRRVAGALTTLGGTGGNVSMYSASITLSAEVQDYDIQATISSSFPTLNPDGKKVVMNKLWYITPRSQWRFFGFFGGINVLGNMTSYGMFADDSQFEIVPVWQHKLQAMQFEDSMYTRTSHYSYELFNNKLRIFPCPTTDTIIYMPKIWFRFYVDPDPWDADGDNSVNGVSNLSNLPFENVPFQTISSIGKHWIKKYSLAICKEILGQIRGKMGNSIPIPGQSVSLNAGELLSQAKEEKDNLKKELNAILDELTYSKVVELQGKIATDTANLKKNVPLLPVVG